MRKNIMMTTGAVLAATGALFLNPLTASAHCDTMDGPVIGDAQKALAEENFSYIAKWVLPEREEDIEGIFAQVMEVRDDSPEAQKLADQYLFENLVRIHREGEGAPYTGVKPEGTPMEEAIVAADRSIATGTLSPLEELVEPELMPQLEEAFEGVLAAKDFDTSNVDAGREYVMNYVTFTHLAEGEEHEEADLHPTAQTDDLNEVENAKAAGEHIELETEEPKASWLPWGLAGTFFVTTIAGFLKRRV